MRKLPAALRPELLEMALEGLEIRKKRVEEQITAIHQMLSTPVQRVPRNRLSAAARKRISEAQKKRWKAVLRAKRKTTRIKPRVKRRDNKRPNSPDTIKRRVTRVLVHSGL